MTTTATQRIQITPRPALPTNLGCAGRRRILVVAGLIAATLIAAVALIAAVTRVAFAAQARGWLGYRFPGVPARPDTAVIIFTHNVIALSGVLGLLLIAQLAAHTADGPGRVQRAVQAGGDLILAAAVAANTLVVGVAIGAYGTRMVGAVLPHGPVELAADTLAIALYLHGRRQTLPARQIAATITSCVALLAVAAVLETFVTV
jgi:hypothetical protein